MSNRLTFSLASLILIFAFAFVATPVMAASGGPTVTFVEYSGVEDPSLAAGTQEMHAQARSDFRVKLTFSHPVTVPTTANVQYRLVNTAGSFLAAAADVSTVTQVYVSGEVGSEVRSETEYVVTVPNITEATATRVIISIAEDVVNGSTLANSLGNVANTSEAYTLPALLAPVTVKFGDVTPVADSNGQQYTVNAIFEDATDAADQALSSLGTAFITDTTNSMSSYITVMPEGDATVTIAAGVEGDANDTTPGVVGEYTHLLTVSLAFGVEPIDGVTLTIDRGYALMADGMTATVDVAATNMPPAYPAGTTAAMVSGMIGTAITPVEAGGATDPESDTITYSWDAADDLGLTLNTSTGRSLEHLQRYITTQPVVQMLLLWSLRLPLVAPLCELLRLPLLRFLRQWL